MPKLIPGRAWVVPSAAVVIDIIWWCAAARSRSSSRAGYVWGKPIHVCLQTLETSSTGNATGR